MRTLTQRFVLPMVLVALVAACGGTRRTAAGDVATPPSYVRVSNQSWLDMNVYVFRSSQRVRLGTVGANRTVRFQLPDNFVYGATPLRFMADPIGSSRTAHSFEIVVAPGDEVSLTIPSTVR